MNKVFIVPVILIATGCATAHERCQEITDNPYEVSLDMTTEDLREVFKRIPGRTPKEKQANLFAKTKFEWQRYGSMNACIASKAEEDQNVLKAAAWGYNAGQGAVANSPLEEQLARETVNQPAPALYGGANQLQPPAAQKAVDHQCVGTCTKAGNGYPLCVSRCSY